MNMYIQCMLHCHLIVYAITMNQENSSLKKGTENCRDNEKHPDKSSRVKVSISLDTEKNSALLRDPTCHSHVWGSYLGHIQARLFTVPSVGPGLKESLISHQ